MEWNEEEQNNKKKGMAISSKILLAIIICLVFIIILICVLLFVIQQNSYKFTIDGKNMEKYIETTIYKDDGITYINIQKFAELLGYEYHKGEYRNFTLENDKCYVKGEEETATFYLNDNKVCKLNVDNIEDDYQVYTIDNTIQEINGQIYAPISAIKIAFNVEIKEGSKLLNVRTLNNLVKTYDEEIKKMGYSGIEGESLENKKALLHGYLIVKSENSGLYKIIRRYNKEEIVSDKYNAIEFTENTEEFFVTNSLGQVGIINLDGTTKIEPIYESIDVLDKESDLYLIKKDNKYGVVKSGNVTVISPEYDKIGLDTSKYTNIENKYLMLNTLIPVCKDNKYGAYDKEGNLVYKLEYEAFGCDVESVEVSEQKKVTQPVLVIERCNGIVVKKAEKYGLLDTTGKTLISIALDSIYSVQNEETEELEYFMIYQNKELNVIERLIKAGLIKKDPEETNETENINNTENNNNQLQNNINNAVNSNNNVLTVNINK